MNLRRKHMKPFTRKIEKILAWIANVIMILMTVLLSLGAFSSQLEAALKQPQLEPVLIICYKIQGFHRYWHLQV